MALFSNPLAQHILGAQSKVLYSCECKQWKPISKLYFCKHCTKLRCANCVAHEVDSFFCPNCLENMPSAEAKLKKNRCANCFDCPSCGHTLSVRATTLHPVIPSPLEEIGKDTTALVKKMHYLYCSFCRWTSRDVGLPDQATPSGGWPEQDLPYSRTMMGLLDYYKQVAHHEKMEKERQKMSKRRSNIYIMDRYGYGLSSLGKKGSSLSSYMSRSSSAPNLQKDLQAPKVSEVSADIEPLSHSYYTQPLVLEDILMLDQRLHEPGIQASSTKYLYPKHKHLMVRRSQRCKECEHNIFKPEFNPSSIKFKIQLGCIQYCPMIQILKCDSLAAKMSCKVIFCITNPLDTIMNIRFEKVDDDYHGNKEDTAHIELPTTSLPIAAKDATVEFDVIGTSNTEVFDDDPNIVHSRGANKLCIYVTVKPFCDTGDVICTFKMMYEYKMVTTPLIRKGDGGGESPPKPEEHLVTFPIFVQVNLGPLNETYC